MLFKTISSQIETQFQFYVQCASQIKDKKKNTILKMILCYFLKYINFKSYVKLSELSTKVDCKYKGQSFLIELFSRTRCSYECSVEKHVVKLYYKVNHHINIVVNTQMTKIKIYKPTLMYVIHYI